MNIRRLITACLILQIGLGPSVGLAEATATATASAEAAARSALAAKLNLGISHIAGSFSSKYQNLRSRLSSETFRARSNAAMAKIKAAPHAVAQSGSHTFQTLLVIWIASIVAAVEQERKVRELSGGKIDHSDQILLEVTQKSVNSFETWAGVVGGGVFATVFAIPMKLLRAVIQNSVARPLLAKLLSAGAASLTVFIGWELGRHLWKEATMLLDSPEEVQIAQNLKFTNVLSGLATEEEKQVYGKIAQNAWMILTFVDPDLGEAWLYNTWRLSIAKGEFLVLVATMTTASFSAASATSAFLGSVMPGAGHVASFLVVFFGGTIGGVAGALIAEKIPTETKEPITLGIRTLRRQAIFSQLHVNGQEIDRILNYYRPGLSRMTSDGYQFGELRRYLNKRANLRNAVATIFFENIYQNYNKILEVQNELNLIEMSQSKDVAIHKKYSGKLESTSKEMGVALSALADQTIYFYIEETRQLQALRTRNEISLPEKFNALLDEHLLDLAFQSQFLVSLLSLLKPKSIQKESALALATTTTDFEMFLNNFYLFGYRESSLKALVSPVEAPLEATN